MSSQTTPQIRVLHVDDDSGIHEDVRKVLQHETASVVELDDSLFEDEPQVSQPFVSLRLEQVSQGRDSIGLASSAMRDGEPYSVAVVDMRMPPGWDGVETVQNLWQLDPRLLIVFCSAYSDHSWGDLARELEHSDQFVMLRKPFEPIELQQLVTSMAARWRTERLLEVSALQLAEALATGVSEEAVIGRRVALVDDEFVDLVAAEGILSKAGATVDAYGSFDDLFRGLSSSNVGPSIVVTGRIDDPAAIARLHEAGYRGRIVGYTRDAGEATSLAAGCDFHVSKSGGPQRLIDFLRDRLPTAM